MTQRILILLLAQLLLACQGGAPRPAAATADDEAINRQGAIEYQIDGAASELRVLVYRAGPLARLGHNHVIVAQDITGRIYRQNPLSRSGFQLQFPVSSLQVDPVTARAQEGPDFAILPAPADIEGTRRNMLGERVLGGTAFPRVTVQGMSLTGAPPEVVLNCRVLLRDAEVALAVPAVLVSGESDITVSGALVISHDQLGMTPFSVMLGALQVAEEMTVKFRIKATRI